MNSNWNVANGLATHTPGATGAMSAPDADVVTGDEYSIQVTVSGMTAGTLTIVSGVTLEQLVISANGTFSFSFTSVGTGIDNVEFNPTTDFDGSFTDFVYAQANATPWTKIPAPAGGTVTTYGTPLGLLLAITREVSVPFDMWTRIPEPTTTWNLIPKAQ